MDFKVEGQAEWDGRQAYMMRLHNIIMQCHLCSYKNDYKGWYRSLLVFKIELSSHLRTDEEKEKVKKAFTKLKSCMLSGDEIYKIEGFTAAQESLHYIMRQRSFDVPINERNPGHALR